MPARRKKPSLARMIFPAEIAEILGFEGPNRIKRARRWMHVRRISHVTPTGRVYTTPMELKKLEDKSPWSEIKARVTEGDQA